MIRKSSLFFEMLGTSEAGLSSEDVERRLQEYGENKFEEKEKTSVLRVFLSKFKSILIFVLIAASTISALYSTLFKTLFVIKDEFSSLAQGKVVGSIFIFGNFSVHLVFHRRYYCIVIQVRRRFSEI